MTAIMKKLPRSQAKGVFAPRMVSGVEFRAFSLLLAEAQGKDRQEHSTRRVRALRTSCCCPTRTQRDGVGQDPAPRPRLVGSKSARRRGRGLGSLAYAIICILVGRQTARSGMQTALMTHAVMLVILAVFTLSFPPSPAGPGDGGAQAPPTPP